MIDWRGLGWRYWFVIASLLTAGLLGQEGAFYVAIGVAAVQCVHFAVRERSVASFPVQVRVGYLALLLVASVPALRPIAWVPVVGTWCRLTWGYCLMARLVALLPWNRSEPLSWAFVRRMLLSRPVRGNVLQGLADRAPRAARP